eukprot:Nitzschia sp. Nitz4//scaffold25_size161228//65267//66064//NITZ4_002427-RA/size161228-processed-gene-0.185-mRNA-1//-1//CDS//3329544577//8499//frame0
MKVNEKVVVVTGGGSGIGRALVLCLLARNSRVAAVDLSPEGLQGTAEEAKAGERLSIHVLNVSDKDAVRALPDAVIAHHGSVDGIINNAGIIHPFVNFRDLDDQTIDKVLQVNLYGTIYVVQAFLPHLEKRPAAHIVNVSSMASFMPFPGQTMYGASKAAVKLFTEGLYTELSGTPVNVSVVMPGAVATNINTNSGVKELPGSADHSNWQLSPESAARIILNGMEANRLHILVGNDSYFLSVLQRLAPSWSISLVQLLIKKALGI